MRRRLQISGPWCLKVFSPFFVVLTLGCKRISLPRKLRHGKYEASGLAVVSTGVVSCC